MAIADPCAIEIVHALEIIERAIIPVPDVVGQLANRVVAFTGTPHGLLRGHRAGGWDRSRWIHIPLGVGRIAQRRLFDWGYTCEEFRRSMLDTGQNVLIVIVGVACSLFFMVWSVT